MATEILSLQEIGVGDSQKEVLHNLALRQLEARCVRVLARQSTPPGSPAEGATYLVTATATGAWAGKEKHIAHYFGGAWYTYAPVEGMRVWDNATDTLYVYDGSAWVDLVDVWIRRRPWIDATTYTRNSDNSTDTQESTLASLTIPAGTLAASSLLRITALWSMTSSASTKTLIARLGGGSNDLLSFAATSVASAQTHTMVGNAGATNSQKSGSKTISAFGTSTNGIVTLSVDTSVNQTLAFLCKWGANVASEAIALERYVIEVVG
jgi:hypothetical protein